MALSPGQSGTIDAIEEDYFIWHGDEARLSVHMHRDAMDGMARDALEGFNALRRRGIEVGGLLLGHVEPSTPPVVWIDRYQRMECEHRFGPAFVLDEDEHRKLEEAANSITQTSDLSVVGVYRSDTRSGFQLDESDFELIGRYFNDPADLMLLIKPANLTEVSAQIFTHSADGTVQSASGPFAFRGRTLLNLESAAAMERDAALASEASEREAGEREEREEEAEPTAQTHSAPREPISREPDLRERPRRLVPDFAPAGEVDRPDRGFAILPSAPVRGAEDTEDTATGLFRKWWPLLGAIVLVAGAAWFLLMPGVHSENPASTTSAASVRPLGLYVEPDLNPATNTSSRNTWRVSWNTGATALQNARSVALLVRDGEDQNRIDLTPHDLQSGTWQYQPRGRDVTFRMETTDAGGHISAESFRLVRTEPPPVPKAAVPLPGTKATTPPRAIHRVPPVVPASIRPRIASPVSIDIRVQVDVKGRVASAAPVGRHRSGLESYLADRAMVAAKQWRFEPARDGGKAVPGSETIHFVFAR